MRGRIYRLKDFDLSFKSQRELLRVLSGFVTVAIRRVNLSSLAFYKDDIGPNVENGTRKY